MQPITFGLGLSISYRARGAFVVEVSDIPVVGMIVLHNQENESHQRLGIVLRASASVQRNRRSTLCV